MGGHIQGTEDSKDQEVASSSQPGKEIRVEDACSGQDSSQEEQDQGRRSQGPEHALPVRPRPMPAATFSIPNRYENRRDRVNHHDRDFPQDTEMKDEVCEHENHHAGVEDEEDSEIQ